MVIVKSILTYSGYRLALKDFDYTETPHNVTLRSGQQIIIITQRAQNEYAIDIESVTNSSSSVVLSIHSNSYYAYLNQSASVQFLDANNESIFYITDTSTDNTEASTSYPLIFYPASKITFDFS